MLMKLVKPTGDAERATQTTLDTIEITKKLAASWKSPPFQRELRPTPRVVALAEDIKRQGILSGVLTLGVLDGDVYIVDGQHRLHAFMLSDALVVYADVRTHYFKTMAAMAEEYVQLNNQLVRLRPDDILKGLEQGNVHLQRIRRKCAYVGYDIVRRGTTGPILSMSTLIRVWLGARQEVPAFGTTAQRGVEQLDESETSMLIDFLGLCFESWRRDPEYAKLWGSLNLMLCAWLYRRVVISDPGKGSGRATKMSPDQFRKSLLALSAAPEYMDYLVGRLIGDRDRSPAYSRLKQIFQQRYTEDTKQKLQLPQPNWSTNHGGRGGHRS